jgi:hypothetical protein
MSAEMLATFRCRIDFDLLCVQAMTWKTLKYWHIVDLHIPHRDIDALGA